MQCGALSCEDLSQWVAESCPDLLDWPRGSQHKWNRPLKKFQTLCVGITAFSQQCRTEFGCLQNVRITSARSRGVCRSPPPSEKVLRAETRALQKMRSGPWNAIAAKILFTGEHIGLTGLAARYRGVTTIAEAPGNIFLSRWMQSHHDGEAMGTNTPQWCMRR